jgi:hypothetical protein
MKITLKFKKTLIPKKLSWKNLKTVMNYTKVYYKITSKMKKTTNLITKSRKSNLLKKFRI